MTWPGLFLPLLLVLAGAISAFYAGLRLPSPDEGATLTNAARILRGGLFYRDIDAYPFPGSHYLLALAMRIFGEHLAVARWLAAAVYLGIVASLYLAALPLLGRRSAAAFGLALLSLKFLAWPAFSLYFYSDVAFLGACGAIALLVRHRFERATPGLVAAGLLAGAALSAKQNVGLYLGAVVGALVAFPAALGVGPPVPARRRLEQLAAFGAGSAIVLLPMCAYFARHGVLGQMVRSGLVRPFTGYLPTSGIDFWPMLAFWRLGDLRGNAAAPYLPADYWHMLMGGYLPGSAGRAPWLLGEIFMRAVYASLPLGLAWFLARWSRTRRARSTPPPLAVLGFTALAVVATAFPRADSFHVMSVYPLAFLLLAALAHRPGRDAGRGVALALVVLLGACGALAAARRAQLDARVTLARADVLVESSDAWIVPLVETIERRVPEGAPIFVYGHEAQLYFLAGRFFPWPFPQLYPGQEGGARGGELAARLESAAPALLLQGVLHWEGVPVIADHAPLLDEYVHAHYRTAPDFFAREAPAVPPPLEWVMTVMERDAAAPVP